LSSYHSGVLAVIAHYHLPQSLDPLGSQNQADNQMLQNAYSDLSGQIVKKEAQALSGTGGSPSGSFSGSGYYEPLAGGAGAGANLGDLTRMLGESGFDLSSLSKLLGGSGFSGEHVDTLLDSGRSLNSLQKLMGGQSGLAGPGGSAASRAPQSPYGSAARSADSGITGFGASSPDDGSFADTSSDKLGDDGFTD
jgi:hypothetical protein